MLILCLSHNLQAATQQMHRWLERQPTIMVSNVASLTKKSEGKMTTKSKKAITAALWASLAVLILMDVPYLLCFGLFMVAVIFPTEVFIRQPALKKLGLDNQNLGGGYYSGGRLTNMANNPNAKGAGGVDAEGLRKGGANAGGYFGQFTPKS